MSDRKEWQHSYQPMNYNGYDSYGSNSQSIGQHYGQYNFTHQGGPNNQYGSSSQFGCQYGGHNYVGKFGGQYGGHNYVGEFGGQYGGTLILADIIL
ncbi:shematrin-like protein 1 [Prunus yedoensis var. nudiflora]|uniref:Shematrin-like protein 1 n=1 Tax=Prunus yedoensis var. nudiflora TaxID=2094558 RepID=A0A314UFM8_PRUYE|nr:shematrin-like protein 1 [Prunus yedoensis var. nudiflora]